MATLTLFCGPPGAGKTTLAQQLEAAGRGVRLCTDDWQDAVGMIGAGEVHDAFHELLQAQLYRHALGLLRYGTDVILEDGLWQRVERARVWNDARATGARIEMHVFDLDLATLWSRLQQRNTEAGPGAHPMSYADLERAWSFFEPPTDEELSAVDAFTRYGRGPADPNA